MNYLLCALLIGIIATAVMDIGALARKRLNPVAQGYLESLCE